MKSLLLTFIASIALFGCASSKKTDLSSSGPEMNKVQEEDIVDAMTKKMDKKNFKAAKIKPIPASPSPQSVLTCRAGDDIRVLEIKSVDERGCELQYTKDGQTKTVANANFNVSYCQTVQSRISKNLESAGFDCK